MIQIDSESIDFNENIGMVTIHVRNTAEKPLLFKIKTNKIKAIDAKPNTGSIPVNATIEVIIRKIGTIEDNTKLQISFTPFSEAMSKQNFKQIWAKNEMNQNSQTLPVRSINISRANNSEKGLSSPMKDTSLNKSQEYNKKFEESVEEIPKEQKKQEQSNNYLFKSMAASSSAYEKHEQVLKDREEDLKKAEKEQQELRKKIEKVNQELKRVSEEKQKSFSVGGQCEKMHLTSLHLFALSFAFLMIGYFFGRS